MRSTSVMLGHAQACETLAVMYLERGSPETATGSTKIEIHSHGHDHEKLILAK